MLVSVKLDADFAAGCALSIVGHGFVQPPLPRPRLRSPDVSECRRHPVRTSKLGATAMGRCNACPLKVQQISSVRCRPPAAIVQPSPTPYGHAVLLVYTTLGSRIEQWHRKRLHKLPFCPAPVNTCVSILAPPVGRAQHHATLPAMRERLLFRLGDSRHRQRFDLHQPQLFACKTQIFEAP
jgi:hypothetical protein